MLRWTARRTFWGGVAAFCIGHVLVLNHVRIEFACFAEGEFGGAARTRAIENPGNWKKAFRTFGVIEWMMIGFYFTIGLNFDTLGLSWGYRYL